MYCILKLSQGVSTHENQKLASSSRALSSFHVNEIRISPLANDPGSDRRRSCHKGCTVYLPNTDSWAPFWPQQWQLLAATLLQASSIHQRTTTNLLARYFQASEENEPPPCRVCQTSTKKNQTIFFQDIKEWQTASLFQGGLRYRPQLIQQRPELLPRLLPSCPLCFRRWNFDRCPSFPPLRFRGH